MLILILCLLKVFKRVIRVFNLISFMQIIGIQFHLLLFYSLLHFNSQAKVLFL